MKTGPISDVIVSQTKRKETSLSERNGASTAQTPIENTSAETITQSPDPQHSVLSSLSQKGLAEQILSDAKSHFVEQDAPNMRYVAKSAVNRSEPEEVVPPGLDRQTAQMIKSFLESQGLTVSLIKAEGAATPGEMFFLEIMLQGNTFTIGSPRNPLLDTDAVIDPKSTSEFSPALQDMDRQARARKAYES
jgi:hypothetical protein